MGEWRSFTKSYKLTDFGSDVPDWALQQRKKQAEQIAALRDGYVKRAQQKLQALIDERLAGPGPWPWAVFYSAWRDVVSELPDWNFRYKSRWLIRELVVHGFEIKGHNKSNVVYVRDSNDEGRKKRARGPKVDSRMISRLTNVNV